MSEYLTLLVYGNSKAGKTWLGASSPKPILTLDAEAGGMRFVPGRKITWDGWSEPPQAGDWDICIVDTVDVDTANRALDWVMTGKTPFKSIVIDSISELQDRIVRSLKAQNGGDMRFQEWGKLLDMATDLAVKGRDVCAAVDTIEALVVIAGMESVNGQKYPMLQGKLRQKLPYKLDAHGMLQVTTDDNGNLRRVLQLVDTKDASGGARLGGLLNDWEWDPNVTELLQKMNNKQNPSVNS